MLIPNISVFFSHCPLVEEREDTGVGKMHHYFRLFRDGWGVIKNPGEYPLDEYTQFLRNTTIQQLKAIQGQEIGTEKSR